MAVGDFIGIREKILKQMYIPTGKQRKLVRFGVNAGLKGEVIGTTGGSVTIHSSGQSIYNLSHIEGITFGAVEDTYAVAGRANVMC